MRCARATKVVLHGDSYDEAAAHAAELSANEGSVYVPPYDDVDVIAGQGTVGMENCQSIPRITRQHICTP